MRAFRRGRGLPTGLLRGAPGRASAKVCLQTCTKKRVLWMPMHRATSACAQTTNPTMYNAHVQNVWVRACTPNTLRVLRQERAKDLQFSIYFFESYRLGKTGLRCSPPCACRCSIVTSAVCRAKWLSASPFAAGADLFAAAFFSP